MRALTLAIVSLLTFAALSGCFAEEKAQEQDAPSETEAGETQGPETNGTTGAGTPPVLSVVVLKDGVQLEALNGTYAVGAAENLTFDASATTDAEAGTITFAWEFGDGTTASGPQVTHSYAMFGSYNATLTLVDNNVPSRTASLTQTVSVTAGNLAPAGCVVKATKTTPRSHRGPARVFELRTYESHNEAANLKKMEMFEKAGEIAIFRRLSLTPVFFARDLVGPTLPSLTYMLVFADAAAREKAWGDFRDDAEWAKLRSAPQAVWR